ncbi:MAG: hypothetical protein IT323_09835 [Anaerolineae bacterium]|nr:hypothetical protein [Anaerolineae bacterium]
MRRRVPVARIVPWIALCLPLLACNLFGVGGGEPTAAPTVAETATPRAPTPTISLPPLRATPTGFSLSGIPTAPGALLGGQSVPTAQFPPRSGGGSGSAAGSVGSGDIVSNCPTPWFFRMSPGLPEIGTCPDQPAVPSPASGQDFEGGRAYYYAPAGPFAQPVVYVIYNDGTFEEYIDTYSPAVMLPPAAPPPERFAPVRAIGKVWSENPAVQSRLGWAYEPERDFAGQRQFSAGDEALFINHGSRNVVVRVDLENGRWVVGGHTR